MAASTATQPLAGHPIAMKVGGRRMSTSKSPSAKSYLASSPPKQTEVPKPTATAADESVKSPTTDDYPRPKDGEHAKEGEGDKEEHKKDDQQGKTKKDKPAFEHVKTQNFNKNPPSQNNFNIKQPAGKTL